VKCHVTEGESRPIPFKNGLSVRFGSDDSGTPKAHPLDVAGYRAKDVRTARPEALTPPVAAEKRCASSGRGSFTSQLTNLD
jgi:hypothetical protein